MATRPSLLPIVLVLSGCLGLSACTTPAEPVAETAKPTASPEVTAAVSPAPAPSPTDTSDAAPTVYTSCDEIITPAFRETVASNGWTGWNMVGQEIGHSPFDAFPGGAPAGQLSCRFGPGPDVPTDNVLDLAWAPIDAAEAQSAQKYLADSGFQRIDVPEGVEWSVRGQDGWADDEGWGQTYLFTDTDVRWAMIRDQLAYLQPAA